MSYLFMGILMLLIAHLAGSMLPGLVLTVLRYGGLALVVYGGYKYVTSS
jgi:hypothetical protein